MRSGTLAAGACALMIAGACHSSVSLSTASPSPTDLGQDSPAASLRVHVDLLFGEHAFVLGKLAVVAAGGRKDEFHSYAGVLAANAVDMATVFKLAVGETGGQQITDAWTEGDNFYVAYLIAAVTQDHAKADAAMTSLTSSYVPRLAAAISSSAGLGSDQATQLADRQVAANKLVMDDAVAAAYPKLLTDLTASHAAAVSFADAVAAQIVGRFPDRFPGAWNSGAATFRSTVNELLQRQAYLLTMLTEAAAGAVQGEVAPVAGALAGNSVAIDARLQAAFGDASVKALDTLWEQESQLLAEYAKSGDRAIGQKVLNRAAPPVGIGAPYAPDLTTAFTAILKVVDDQRGTAFDTLGGDDRAAAVEFTAAADEITEAAVRLAPAKLS